MPVKRSGEQAEDSQSEGAELLQQWQLEVRLQRAGGGRAGTSAARVYAPRFPKACPASCPKGDQASPQGRVEGAGLQLPCSPVRSCTDGRTLIATADFMLRP